jgi:hypothetical protein
MLRSYTRLTIGSICCKLLILQPARVLARHTGDQTVESPDVNVRSPDGKSISIVARAVASPTAKRPWKTPTSLDLMSIPVVLCHHVGDGWQSLIGQHVPYAEKNKLAVSIIMPRGQWSLS